MDVKTIFFDPDKKLRSGWRVVVFIATVLPAAVLLSVLVQWLVGGEGVPAEGSVNAITLGAVGWLLASILIGWLCGYTLEALPFRALGAAPTPGWISHAASGLVLGAATIALAVGLAALFGGLRFALNEAGSAEIFYTLAFSFAVFAIAAAFEEALFRGYILQTLARSGYAWPAIFITAGFFGMAHLGNANAGLISTINTVLAGIWFGLAYMRTRDLWLVWGLHFAWNWMQGAVFGIEVSGLKDITPTPLLVESDHGPTWLTGGEYGVEAGIACTIALIACMAAIWFAPFLRADPEMVALTSPPALTPADPAGDPPLAA